jgi:UDP-glucose 4-epimerase
LIPNDPAEARRLTVAVTGPTGDIGKSVVRALERSPKVGRIIGMARRPFEPAEHGWRRAEYRRGDVLDRASVDALAEGADVVVHLAFLIFGSRQETREVNLEGSRNVFEAAAAAGAKRLVYTSSVAAYGFHEDNPELLTEEVRPRGTDEFYYSAQKAELEDLVWRVVEGSGTEAYVFRPCIVAGADAPALIEQLQMSGGGRLAPLRRLLGSVPRLKPALPDAGTPLQLVHHDDVATALRAAVVGRGAPGTYNLAGEGALTVGDIARELGWYSFPIPGAALDLVAGLIPRVPFMPAKAAWVYALRTPVLMDTTKARRQLGWRPKHSSRETLRETVANAQAAGIL